MYVYSKKTNFQTSGKQCENMCVVSDTKIAFPGRDICLKLSNEYISDEQCDFLKP